MSLLEKDEYAVLLDIEEGAAYRALMKQSPERLRALEAFLGNGQTPEDARIFYAGLYGHNSERTLTLYLAARYLARVMESPPIE